MRDYLSKMKEQIRERAPNILHTAGTTISFVSIASDGNYFNPHNTINGAVGILLGDGIKDETRKEYLPENEIALKSIYHGTKKLEYVKALFGIALAVPGAIDLMHGHTSTALLDAGIWISTLGEEIKRRRVKEAIKDLNERHSYLETNRV